MRFTALSLLEYVDAHTQTTPTHPHTLSHTCVMQREFGSEDVCRLWEALWASKDRQLHLFFAGERERERERDTERDRGREGGRQAGRQGEAVAFLLAGMSKVRLTQIETGARDVRLGHRQRRERDRVWERARRAHEFVRVVVLRFRGVYVCVCACVCARLCV